LLLLSLAWLAGWRWERRLRAASAVPSASPYGLNTVGISGAAHGPPTALSPPVPARIMLSLVTIGPSFGHFLAGSPRCGGPLWGPPWPT
jgi:hypothetical protein